MSSDNPVWGNNKLEALIASVKGEKISVTVAIALILCCWQIYVWAGGEFVSKAEGKAIVVKLDNHIIDSTLYRLDRDIQQANDDIWKLEERMQDPSGNTPERRQKLAEYRTRAANLTLKRDCVLSNREDVGICFPGHR